ncbi:MAG: hypothetical protein H0V73_02950 [Chloroflexi bacterium]|nr:hypothetical protein [Chloroflexota bacterium]
MLLSGLKIIQIFLIVGHRIKEGWPSEIHQDVAPARRAPTGANLWQSTARDPRVEEAVDVVDLIGRQIG